MLGRVTILIMCTSFSRTGALPAALGSQAPSPEPSHNAAQVIPAAAVEEGGRLLAERQRWRDTGGADPHWWNVGGLILGWNELKGALESNFLDDLWGRIDEWLLCAANISFVIAVALGFLWLPRELMLVLGALGIFIGPIVIEALLKGLGFLFAVSAYLPGVVVCAMWALAFMSSKMVKTIAFEFFPKMDRDHDADVDLSDLAYEVLGRVSPRLQKKLEQRRQKLGSMQTITERLERLERMLIAISKGEPVGEDASLTKSGLGVMV